MKVIVGLGNPGKDYARTRHNVGFDLVDSLAAANGIQTNQRLYRSLVGRGQIAGQRVMLVKPQTFMNLSGEAVSQIVQREQLPLENLFVVSDDIHLPVGRIRLRAKGSSGGQNGLKSIATRLGSQEWARLRIGVGQPPPGLQIDWVLSSFSRADRKMVDETLITAMGAVDVWLTDGIEAAMNRFNGTTE
jgi:PTH1 family peptidyl-tRNA hydrolase